MAQEISGLFLIVMHSWFMVHKAWQTKLVNAVSLREAEKEAALWKSETESQFLKVATLVVPLQLVPQKIKE